LICRLLFQRRCPRLAAGRHKCELVGWASWSVIACSRVSGCGGYKARKAHRDLQARQVPKANGDPLGRKVLQVLLGRLCQHAANAAASSLSSGVASTRCPWPRAEVATSNCRLPVWNLATTSIFGLDCSVRGADETLDVLWRVIAGKAKAGREAYDLIGLSKLRRTPIEWIESCDTSGLEIRHIARHHDQAMFKGGGRDHKISAVVA
jgi:hypothetical protein